MARLVHSGFLFKAPPKNENLLTKFAVQWRWRCFKLWSNKEFHYYEDYSCSRKKGSIKLDKVDIGDIKYPIALPKHPWVISINVVEENREYLLAAADEQSLLSWADALESVLKVDYIKVSEIASTNNFPDKKVRTDSVPYLKIFPEERDRAQSYQSSIFSDFDPMNASDLQMDRVSPYEIHDPDLERKESGVSEDDIYMPMDPNVSNEDDVIPSPEINQESPANESPKTENIRKEQTDKNYVVCDIDENVDDSENDTFISSVYEAMTPSQIPENATEGCDNNEKLDDVSPLRNDRYDHLTELHDFMSGVLDKAEELRSKRVEMKSQSTSDYDDVENFRRLTEEGAQDFSRLGRAHTINQVEVENEEQPMRPRKGSGLEILEELRKGEVGKFQCLLESYWVMHIYLPNRTVMKELVNLEAPVEVLIEKIARLFGQQNNLHIFSLYVLSDIHQTYEVSKKADRDLGKGDLRLNHNMSFVDQGITTAKFLQIVSTKEIDRASYDRYLKEKDGVKLTQEFCETWVPFVKGYFSIPDLREVAILAGYIHFVYQTIYDLKSISHEIFLPRNAKEIEECIKKAREQSLQLKGTNIKDACRTFINRIVIWPTANTIAFPIKRVEKANFRMKHTEILVVFAKEHIGIVKAEKNNDYSNFMYWWHKNDISDFEVKDAKDILVIKLTKPFDEGSCEFQLKSPMNKILNQLLENFKTTKKRLAKYNSCGNIKAYGINSEDIPLNKDDD